MRWLPVLTTLLATAVSAQSPAPGPVTSLEALRFLEGTWEAKTPALASGATVPGTYAFRRELDGHILARHSSNDGCKGPADFDCDHRDLLYIYQDGPLQPVQAIYFDSEGHVIHYDVSTPDATKAVLLSPASKSGPQFCVFR